MCKHMGKGWVCHECYEARQKPIREKISKNMKNQWAIRKALGMKKWGSVKGFVELSKKDIEQNIKLREQHEGM